jgi:hypothetical protein
MRGLVPRIHAFLVLGKDVDGRDKPGHDVLLAYFHVRTSTNLPAMAAAAAMAGDTRWVRPL